MVTRDELAARCLVALLSRDGYDGDGAERDAAQRGWDAERLNHMGDLHYIAKATGYPYATTEAQPERAIEIVGAVTALSARVAKLEAALRFYANGANYSLDPARGGIGDQGYLARIALEDKS